MNGASASNFVPSASSSLTTPSKPRMSVIKPTHSPGTLGLSSKKTAAASTQEANAVQGEAASDPKA